MKKIVKHIIALSVTALTALSCQKETCNPDMPGEDGFIEIRVSATSPLMKSSTLIDPMEGDPIYLYAYDQGNSYIQGCIPIGIENGVYTYNIPENTYSMVFSNLAVSDQMEIRSGQENDDFIVSFNYIGSTGEDMVLGMAFISDLNEDGSFHVDLKRVTSKITAQLHIVDDSGTRLDCFDYIQYAGMNTLSQYSGFMYSKDYELEYFGQRFQSIAGTIVTEYTQNYTICDSWSVLPTTDGNAGIEVWMVDYTGQTIPFSATLGYPFEANKHYMLTINVRRGDAGFGFTLEDIITEEINIDLN